MGETQEVKCLRGGWDRRRNRGAGCFRWLKPDQSGLLRVDCQAVFAHPLGQHSHDPPRIVFSGHPDHEVVRIANQERLALQAGANVLLEPSSST